MGYQLYHFPFQALGSSCAIQLYARDAEHARHVAEAVEADVRRIEDRYSRYLPDSALSAINRVAAAGNSATVDDETLALLNYADTCYRQSGGLFDITSGVLREAWDFKSGILPSKRDIQAILPRVGWEKVSISGGTISFEVPGMQLDFGGIGKEYAVDRAATLCRQHGMEYGLVDLGGDIKIIGPHADGRPWTVGIRHPRKPGRTMAGIKVFRGGVASSGDYERCIVLNGKRYSHILNPLTGWPVSGIASITVIAEQCVIAGSVATITMLKGHRGKEWIEELGLSYLWMDERGKIGGTLANPDI